MNAGPAFHRQPAEMWMVTELLRKSVSYGEQVQMPHAIREYRFLVVLKCKVHWRLNVESRE